MEQAVERYMELPYTIKVVHDETAWFAQVEELPGCMTFADTWEALGPMIDDAMRLWITASLEQGWPIPEPVAV